MKHQISVRLMSRFIQFWIRNWHAMTVPRLSVLILLFAMLGTIPAYAQESGLAFLRMGPNAESAGMGDAHVASSRDAFSTFWNPAGLAAAERNSAAGSYQGWVGDVKIFAAAVRLGAGSDGAFGLFVTANGTDDLEARDLPGPSNGDFSVQFVNAGLAYARTFGPVHAGATAKYLTERIYTESSSGYGFDFGVQADVLSEGLYLGAALQNVGRMTELLDESTELPMLVRLGGAFFPLRVLMSDDDATLLETEIVAEVVHIIPENVTQIHAGVGAEMLDVITLRTGYISNDSLRKYSFGLGFEYQGVIFDYAFLPFESGFEGPGHVLTLTYEW